LSCELHIFLGIHKYCCKYVYIIHGCSSINFILSCELLIWLLSFFVGSLSIMLFCLQSFDPQYSLIFSNFLSLDMCMCFHFFLAMHTLRRNSHYIGLLSLSAHFGNGCQWGRSFKGLKGIGLHTLVLFLNICLACFAWLSIYSGNSTNNISWQYMQWNSISFTHA
jgi:hypothetical protein